MKSKDSLKLRLKKGEVVLGGWCILPSSPVMNVIATSGLDFLIIDMEHGAHDFQTVEEMIRAAEVENCVPLVRVSRNDESLILRILDMNAYGVVVPHVKTTQDAASAISGAKYYPLGQRGFSPFTRAGKYSLDNIKTHSKTQNERTVVVLMLEGKEGIANLGDILNMPDIKEKVDVIYIGVYDLSQAVGFPGQVDHPKVRKALEDCIKKIKSSGLAAGGYVAKDKLDMQWMCDMGMQFITLLPDCTILLEGYRNLTNSFSSLKVSKKR